MTATKPERTLVVEDATMVRSQPALTTSTGAIWLIAGGLLAATGIAILVPMIGLGAPSIAVAAIISIAALYAAMMIVRFAIPSGRIRLGLLTAGMVGIAVVEFGCVGMITALEWNLLP